MSRKRKVEMRPLLAILVSVFSFQFSVFSEPVYLRPSDGDLADLWPSLPHEVVLLHGTFEPSGPVVLASGQTVAGMGIGETTVRGVSGTAVFRIEGDGARLSDLTIVCHTNAPKCNGVSIVGDSNRVERLEVRGVWGQAAGNAADGSGDASAGHEGFAIIPYGHGNVVERCRVVEFAGDYAVGVCPVGSGTIIRFNRVIGPGHGRTAAFGLYNAGGVFEYNRFEGVSFGFYGDVGGHTPEMRSMDWEDITIQHNEGQASEAAFRIQTLGQAFRRIKVEHNDFFSPRLISCYEVQHVDGKPTWPATTDLIAELTVNHNTFRSAGSIGFKGAGIEVKGNTWAK